ncbi:MAG: D-tyrosyl-tRNA(Tyr) deacylase [Deinococcus sp.]|nr:D-tyrosyl-tRNA(Tyr) deacylase [Deinococcus sp.]
MRAVVQRAARARVVVDGQAVGQIGPGLAVLLGVAVDDAEHDAQYLAHKLARLRIFSDDTGKLNRSALELGLPALVVSQFTLLGDTTGGNRPSFTKAAPLELGERLYRAFIVALRAEGLQVEEGIFRAMMQFEVVNDGPVTIIIDTAERRAGGAP